MIRLPPRFTLFPYTALFRSLLESAAADRATLRALVDRRVAGEPLEHLLGWAEFRGLRIAVEAGVFVPRRRTEFLVEQALALVRPGAVVVDLCCGSGAVDRKSTRLNSSHANIPYAV